MKSTWTDAELAYFAGIVDGEGCFCLHNNGSNVFSCALSVGNTDPRLPQWIQERFGGRIRRQQFKDTRCKVFYRWSLPTRELESVITAVLPYLVLKRDQAELMLAYRKTIVPRGSGQRQANVPVMDRAAIKERRKIHAKLALLNKRGVPKDSVDTVQ